MVFVDPTSSRDDPSSVVCSVNKNALLQNELSLQSGIRNHVSYMLGYKVLCFTSSPLTSNPLGYELGSETSRT